ncbi:MAG: hypothetical protein J0L61_00335 [Planctomycetes bacterium]|nr:hypothetical protein [Planctomycetota bacterium]
MGNCKSLLAMASGVLALAGIAVGETNVINSPMSINPTGAGNQAGINPKNLVKTKVRIRLAAEEIGNMDQFLRETGPIADPTAWQNQNQFEDAQVCAICPPSVPLPSLNNRETALPTAWTTYGDAFASASGSLANGWLRDQGCFIIIGCFGTTAGQGANALQLPAAFTATSSLVPTGSLCGYISNFNAPNDAAATGPTVFAIPPANEPNGPTFNNLPPNATHPSCVNQGSVATLNNQRDQDYLRIQVPAGGIDNFRLFVTAENEFEASLICNNQYPQPGVVNGCWTDPNSTGPEAEFGFVPAFGGVDDAAATNATEGRKNLTWAWPRFIPSGFNLGEGEYLITVRPKAFASLDPPSVALPPTTKYQIQIQGAVAVPVVGACCTVNNNGCLDNVASDVCENTNNGVFRGEATTCAAINSGTVPCNLTCAGTNEGTSRDCPNSTDQNIGCSAVGGLLDLINAGQTICGRSGGTNVGTGNLDIDWFEYTAGAAQESLKFLLSNEAPMSFFFFYVDGNAPDPCETGTGFGFSFDASRNSEIELCVAANQTVYVAVLPAISPSPCGDNTGGGSGNGIGYSLTLQTGACLTAACCTASGTCSDLTGPACYAAGGVSVAGTSAASSVNCANFTCCSDAAICTGTNTTEAALPRTPAGGPSSETCVDATNYQTRTDLYNGGCDNTGATFSVATAGNVICGKSNSYFFVGDADWYAVTTTSESYVGAAVNGRMDLDISMYKAPTGGGCPSDAAGLDALLVESSAVAINEGPGCADTTIVGDCLPAGTYYFRVESRFSNIYDVPCVSGSGANYKLQIISNFCIASSNVACTGTAENEANCQETNSNGGCNTEPTPNFGSIACNGTVCGTADLLAGTRDTDWYQIAHTGGQFKVETTAAFWSIVSIFKPGTTGPAGCDDATFVDGREFIAPGTPVTITIPALAAGTYWVVVAPDFDGTSRVCCAIAPGNTASGYSLKVSCTPTCACFFDLTGDCIVNTADLTAFLGQFGKTCAQVAPARCADVNNDGVVNTADLTGFLGQFGKNGNTNPGVCQ